MSKKLGLSSLHTQRYSHKFGQIQFTTLNISDIFMLCLSRSHDGFQEKSDGVLEPAGGSSYASQRRVFEDLGQGVLDNAFEGIEQIFKRIIF